MWVGMVSLRVEMHDSVPRGTAGFRAPHSPQIDRHSKATNAAACVKLQTGLGCAVGESGARSLNITIMWSLADADPARRLANARRVGRTSPRRGRYYLLFGSPPPSTSRSGIPKKRPYVAIRRRSCAFTSLRFDGEVAKVVGCKSARKTILHRHGGILHNQKAL